MEFLFSHLTSAADWAFITYITTFGRDSEKENSSNSEQEENDKALKSENVLLITIFLMVGVQHSVIV